MECRSIVWMQRISGACANKTLRATQMLAARQRDLSSILKTAYHIKNRHYYAAHTSACLLTDRSLSGTPAEIPVSWSRAARHIQPHLELLRNILVLMQRSDANYYGSHTEAPLRSPQILYAILAALSLQLYLRWPVPLASDRRRACLRNDTSLPCST
jgi:hypothetical protein